MSAHVKPHLCHDAGCVAECAAVHVAGCVAVYVAVCVAVSVAMCVAVCAAESSVCCNVCCSVCVWKYVCVAGKSLLTLNQSKQKQTRMNE